MAKRRNQRHRREQRQEAAQARHEARAKRSNADQLAKLEAAGHGHCKEAEKLRKREG